MQLGSDESGVLVSVWYLNLKCDFRFKGLKILTILYLIFLSCTYIMMLGSKGLLPPDAYGLLRISCSRIFAPLRSVLNKRPLDV